MEAHWLKLAPGLNKVPGGKTTPHNIFFEPILPKFEENFKIGVDEIGCSITSETYYGFYVPVDEMRTK